MLASCALPLAFLVVPIEGEHFGDGSMHQLAPMSAALHLGARRVLLSGWRNGARRALGARSASVALVRADHGHMLDAQYSSTRWTWIWNDCNGQPDAGIHPGRGREPARAEIRTIEALVIRPSEPIAEIAAAHAHERPESCAG